MSECTCIRCDMCHGTGNVWGENRANMPFDDLETCDECRGTGFVEMCELHDNREFESDYL